MYDDLLKLAGIFFGSFTIFTHRKKFGHELILDSVQTHYDHESATRYSFGLRNGRDRIEHIQRIYLMTDDGYEILVKDYGVHPLELGPFKRVWVEKEPLSAYSKNGEIIHPGYPVAFRVEMAEITLWPQWQGEAPPVCQPLFEEYIKAGDKIICPHHQWMIFHEYRGEAKLTLVDKHGFTSKDWPYGGYFNCFPKPLTETTIRSVIDQNIEDFGDYSLREIKTFRKPFDGLNPGDSF